MPMVIKVMIYLKYLHQQYYRRTSGSLLILKCQEPQGQNVTVGSC